MRTPRFAPCVALLFCASAACSGESGTGPAPKPAPAPSRVTVTGPAVVTGTWVNLGGPNNFTMMDCTVPLTAKGSGTGSITWESAELIREEPTLGRTSTALSATLLVDLFGSSRVASGETRNGSVYMRNPGPTTLSWRFRYVDSEGAVQVATFGPQQCVAP